MAVYFMLEENDDDWRMKIGRAKDRVAGPRALQTGNPRALRMVSWIDAANDGLEEARLEVVAHQQ